MSTSTKALISEFLAKRRIAVAGVSRNEKDFSRMLFRDLRLRGFDAIPVNPGTGELEGMKCYPSVTVIPPPVEAALIMTPPQQTAGVVKDCFAAGIPLVWMYRAIGSGAVDEQAVEWCQANGIAVIPGHCPYMFLPDGAWFHKVHGFFAKLTGAYPH